MTNEKGEFICTGRGFGSYCSNDYRIDFTGEMLMDWQIQKTVKVMVRFLHKPNLVDKGYVWLDRARVESVEEVRGNKDLSEITMMSGRSFVVEGSPIDMMTKLGDANEKE